MINVDDFEDSLRSQIRDKVIEVLGEIKIGRASCRERVLRLV